MVLYHFALGFPGGFAGVDVFFVISGYLITAILLRRLATAPRRFSFANFWKRRCRRLFPASAVVLAVVLAVGNGTMLREQYTKLSHQTAAVLLLGANFHFYNVTDSYFFDQESIPLLHCWSLAVEEQFYLVSPLALSTLFVRRCGSHGGDGVRAAVFLAVAVFASFAFAVVLAPVDPNFAFFLLPSRVWEMCVGGLAWLFECYMARSRRGEAALSPSSAMLPEIASWIGLGSIALSYFVYDKNTRFPSYPALLPCLGTCLFLIYTGEEHGTYASKLLGSVVPRFIGKMSYSWYLWHWPIFVLLAQSSASGDGTLSAGETAWGLFGSFAAGVASFAKPWHMTREGLWQKP